MKAILGSTNKHKLKAVKDALAELYPKEKTEVVGIETRSGAQEQPIGNEETIKGARNRALQTQKAGKKADFYVGLENGLIQVKNKWFDVAWCVVIDKNGKESLIPSAGVFFPEKYVTEAKKRGFETTTACMILHEEIGPESESTDPHTILTNNKVSRSKLLEEALKIAIGQLNTKYL